MVGGNFFVAFSVTYLFKARQNFGVSLIIHKVLGSLVRPVFYLALALRQTRGNVRYQALPELALACQCQLLKSLRR
jgi:hypothetical protein